MKNYFKGLALMILGACFTIISCTKDNNFDEPLAKSSLEDYYLQLTLDDQVFNLNGQSQILMNPGQSDEYVKTLVLPESLYVITESSNNEHLVFGYSEVSNDEIHLLNFNEDKTQFDVKIIKNGATIQLGRMTSNQPYTAKCGNNPRCWWSVITVAVEIIIDSFDDTINCSVNAVTGCGEGNVDSVTEVYSDTVVGEVVACSYKCK